MENLPSTPPPATPPHPPGKGTIWALGEAVCNLLIGVTVVVFSLGAVWNLFGPWLSSPRVPPSAIAPVPVPVVPDPDPSPRVDLSPAVHVARDEFTGFLHVRGTVRNPNAFPVNVAVRCVGYDDAHVRVGDGNDLADKLGAGETWAYDITIVGSSITHVGDVTTEIWR